MEKGTIGSRSGEKTLGVSTPQRSSFDFAQHFRRTLSQNARVTSREDDGDSRLSSGSEREGEIELTEGLHVMHDDLRPGRPGRRGRKALKMAGNILYCAFFGLLLLISLILGVGNATSASQRTYSGTFAQHSCESGYRGRCEAVGTWVSDSGSIIKKNIQLDGDVNSDGTVAASYTPTGFNDDAENNIVHTATWAGAKFWFPWAMVLLFAGLILYRLRLLGPKYPARRAPAPR